MHSRRYHRSTAAFPLFGAALGVSILATLIGAPASAQPAVADPKDPFLVNTFTDGGQEVPDVARSGSGYVIVWESDAEFNEVIFGQRFDDGGNRLGEEFNVSVGDRNMTNPAVAQRGDGFVVVWQTADEDNIAGQLFDAQGQKVGQQGIVNVYREDTQEFPAIASDAQGNFVVVFESFKWPGDGDGDAIVARLFSSNAQPLTSDFLVNSVIADDQQDPAVGRQPGGSFLVAWESDDSNNSGIFARIFDADGVPQGLQFEVPVVSENNQETPAVGAWADGYVVAWESPDDEGKGIWARRFDSSGAPLGEGQFLVNTLDQDRDQKFPSVSAYDDGEFVIAWKDDDFGAFAREYNADGTPLGNEFQVGISDPMEEEPKVAVRDGGGFLITWFGAGVELDNDVFGKNYVVPEPGATALGLAALSTLAGLARRRSAWS